MTLDDGRHAASHVEPPRPRAERRAGRSLLARLARRLGLAPIPADAAEQLAGLQSTTAALARAQADSQHALSALHAMVEKTDKQLARLGKEQFKANLLGETQRQHTQALLDEIRAASERHERELAELRERMARARAAGRIELVKSMLPALDGMDEALASGERLLAASAGAAVASLSAPSSVGEAPLALRQRLGAALNLLLAPPKAEPRPPGLAPAPGVPREAVAGWLRGLGLVQERLIELLAAEGVYPIETEDEPFDPHQHVAVDSVPAGDGLAPGHIVRELRRGYRRDDGTVLRHAEVVVARDTPAEQPRGD